MEDVRETLLQASGLGAGHPKRLVPFYGVLQHHASNEEPTFFWGGPPQIIQLGVECTGNPKVKQSPVLTKVAVFYKGKDPMKFNSMYVCTLKVAGNRHGITAQPKRGDIVNCGFLGSHNSVSSDCGGGVGGGARGERVEES